MFCFISSSLSFCGFHLSYFVHQKHYTRKHCKIITEFSACLCGGVFLFFLFSTSLGLFCGEGMRSTVLENSSFLNHKKWNLKHGITNDSGFALTSVSMQGLHSQLQTFLHSFPVNSGSDAISPRHAFSWPRWSRSHWSYAVEMFAIFTFSWMWWELLDVHAVFIAPVSLARVISLYPSRVKVVQLLWVDESSILVWKSSFYKEVSCSETFLVYWGCIMIWFNSIHGKTPTRGYISHCKTDLEFQIRLRIVCLNAHLCCSAYF